MYGRKDWRKSTLGERVEFVRTTFHPKLRDGELGVNELGDATGLKGAGISRLGKPGSTRGTSIESARSFAEATGVSFVWLALGEGQPGDPNPWVGGRCRDLEIAIAYASAEVFTDETIADARRDAELGLTLTPLGWAKRMAELQGERASRVLLLPAAPVEDPRVVFERAREEGPEYNAKAWERAWKTFTPGQDQATVEAFRKRAEVAYFRSKKSFMAKHTIKEVDKVVEEENLRHSSLPPNKSQARKPGRA